MTDSLNLLQQIIADTHDDTLRLVYADALDEEAGHETPRAALIRYQIADRKAMLIPILTQMRQAVGPGLSGTITADGHRKGIDSVMAMPDVMVGLNAEDAGVRFNPVIRRGFVEEVTCKWADWARNGDQIAWHPSMRRQCLLCFGIGSVPDQDGDFEQCPVCNGTGEEPAPCPDTAQPIRKVTITDEVFLNDFRDDAKSRLVSVKVAGRIVFATYAEIRVNRPNWTVNLCASILLPRRWPGVTFVANRSNLYPRD